MDENSSGSLKRNSKM